MTKLSTELLTRYEVAELLHVKAVTLYRYQDNEEMDFPKPIKIGRKVFYRLSDIQTWIDSQ